MFTLISVANPRYGNLEETVVDCDVQWAEFASPHPFTADPKDPEPHGREIYNDLKAGKYGPIAPYVAPVLTPANNQPVTTGTQAA
jgi:hypothetical protein